MNNLPNLITLARFPLVFLFLIDDVFYRCLALVLGLASDVLDGYIARKYNLSSQLGAILDPIMDKFFVIFILAIFIQEGRLTIGEASAMISRDFAVLVFGAYLACRGRLPNYRIRAIKSGKVATFLQFVVLIALTCQLAIPAYAFYCFAFLGFLALIELYIVDRAVLSLISIILPIYKTKQKFNAETESR